MTWIGTVVQLPGQSMEEATANINQWVCAYDARVHGKRKAKKMAKRFGRDYIFQGANVGQPRLVECASEPFPGQELPGLEYLDTFEKEAYEMTETPSYITEEFVDSVVEYVFAFMSNHANEVAGEGQLVAWDLDGLERGAIRQLIAGVLANDGYAIDDEGLDSLAKAVRERVSSRMTKDPGEAVRPS